MKRTTLLEILLCKNNSRKIALVECFVSYDINYFSATYSGSIIIIIILLSFR